MSAKVGAGTLNLFLVERLWKRNRTAATVLMIASNAAMSVVVANNFKVIH